MTRKLLHYRMSKSTCPHCKMDLTKQDAITIRGVRAHLENGDVIESDTDHTYVISIIRAEDIDCACTRCKGDLRNQLNHYEEREG
jgi:hypothetical protein